LIARAFQKVCGLAHGAGHDLDIADLDPDFPAELGIENRFFASSLK